MRIGSGFDVHRVEPGKGIVLGGVDIPCDLKLVAHSDGDVLLHAICDALLGAAGLGDIGRHFPDTEAQYRNISSRKLLRHTVALLAEKRLKLSSLDCTLIAERPKVAPFSEQMKDNIASDTGLDKVRVNIKATTTEGIGFIGRGEGIAAQAVCLLIEES